MLALEKYRRKNDDDARLALTAGATGLGAATAYHGLHDYLRDLKMDTEQPRTKHFSDFQASLKPGDMLFYRRPTAYSGTADLGKLEFPFKEAAILLGGKGDTFYHPAIYKGRGLIQHAEDWKKGIRDARIDRGVPEEIMAMRAKNPKDTAKALNIMKELRGVPYKSEWDVVGHGLKHLAGVGEKTGNYCKKTGNGLVCSEFVAESYPSIFKSRTMSPRDMRNAEGLEFVSRYSPRTHGVTAMDKALVYGVHPLARSLKWGALAAGGAYGAAKLAKWLKNNEGDQA